MNILLIIILFLIAEYIGDFLLQSREMALNKSKKIFILLKHCGLIFLALIIFAFIPLFVVYGLNISIGLISVMLAYVQFHAFQDWFLWRGYSAFVQRRLERETENEILKIGLHRNNTFKNILKTKLDKFVDEKEYAEDKVFYDFIGLDRTLHIIVLIVLIFIFLG